MTSLIPYHAEAEPTERFSSLSPSELSKLCHLDLYASLRPGDDPVAIRVLLHVIYPARSETQVGVNRAFSPPSFSRRAPVYPCFTHRCPFLSSGSVLAREFRTPRRSMPRITSRTRTLTAIGDLYFPDPYYLNAGAFVRRMVPRW